MTGQPNSSNKLRPLAALILTTCCANALGAALEEIIVTAQKREQSLQETPIAITAFDAESLREQGIADIEDASQYIPNVQIAESPAGSTGAVIAIRGSVTINPAVTWEQTVGVYLDGVFIGKTAGGLFDVAELERLEVLRGPQGSLYGKNTVGGAINLITRKPSGNFGGNISLGLGNYGLQTFGLSVDSDEINDALSLSLSYLEKRRDGFDYNLANNSEFKALDSQAGRLSALYDVSETITVGYSYDWSDLDNTPALAQMVATPDYNRPASANLDGAIYDRAKTSGHSVQLKAELGDITLKSITAYREMNFDDTVDLDNSDMIGFHTRRMVEQDQLSQEFQLSGQVGDVSYIAGLFYYNESAKTVNPYQFGSPTGPFIVRNFYGVDSEAFALFGQAEWAATDQLSISLGLRWTEEEKDFSISHPDDFVAPFTTSASNSWENFSPSLSVSYAWSDQLNSYLRIARGWKSGGFNGESENLTVAETPYNEEEVTSYEIGIKSLLLDIRLQLNAALFQNNTTDMQLSEFLGASGYSQINNAGEATVTGFELELVAAASDELTLHANYGYLDAKYDKFISYGVDVKASALFPYSPENTWSIGAQYSRQALSARIDYSFVDTHDLYYDQASAATTSVSDYNLLNARISWDVAAANNVVTLSVWGKNLTDEEYYINGIPLGEVGLNYFGNPRTTGVDISWQF